jgi:hypothetical protein
VWLQWYFRLSGDQSFWYIQSSYVPEGSRGMSDILPSRPRLTKMTYINKYHSRFIPEGVERTLRYPSETPTFYQNYLAMSNDADVTGGKPIAVWSQFTFSHLLRHPWKRNVLFFYFIPDTTRDIQTSLIGSFVYLGSDGYGLTYHVCGISHSEVILCHLVWYAGQNKRIAPLSFFHGCRKRPLKD